MGDKNPKHPLKKKKMVTKTTIANQEVPENDGTAKKSKKHTY